MPEPVEPDTKMKTHKNLFRQITSFDNLLAAAAKAQRGKRFKRSTAIFNLELEKNLFRIQRMLLGGLVPSRPLFCRSRLGRSVFLWSAGLVLSVPRWLLTALAAAAARGGLQT